MAADTPAEPCPGEERWEYTLHIPHDARAIGIARSTLHAVLVRYGLPELLDVATLLATELVTNAYLHSGGPASLRLRCSGGRLRLGVWDTDPTPPAGADQVPVADRESGRGLLLVNACADAWGWFLLGDDIFGARGKFVWCELNIKPDPEYWDVAA
ncbi:ATP-binding protein [Streptomyces sp. DSM 42041]|uniref:ATP-binding protein n=1 Tax=Streptomyces hazeniae TaxID=3075538 RepID=A0ABU2NKW2_9ACTN|nr:ATP-binding protein [Streptomyces sp. DSM 42041]MDT0377619.1 ATP-binding protein [Streptomyces sp. DSM 42041]